MSRSLTTSTALVSLRHSQSVPGNQHNSSINSNGFNSGVLRSKRDIINDPTVDVHAWKKKGK